MKLAVVLHSTQFAAGAVFQCAITYRNFSKYSNMFTVSVQADNLRVMLKHAREGVNGCVLFILLLCNVSIWFVKIYLLFGQQHTATNTIVVTFVSTASSLTIFVLMAALFAPQAC